MKVNTNFVEKAIRKKSQKSFFLAFKLWSLSKKQAKKPDFFSLVIVKDVACKFQSNLYLVLKEKKNL